MEVSTSGLVPLDLYQSLCGRSQDTWRIVLLPTSHYYVSQQTLGWVGGDLTDVQSGVLLLHVRDVESPAGVGWRCPQEEGTPPVVWVDEVGGDPGVPSVGGGAHSEEVGEAGGAGGVTEPGNLTGIICRKLREYSIICCSLDIHLD